MLTPRGAPMLPGDVLWHGIPSFLFGANDAYNWAGADGFDSNALTRTNVANAHIPLIRCWFFQYENMFSGVLRTDALQIKIASQARATGAKVMGVLAQQNSDAYNLSLVTMLANYVDYWEVGNEPDYSGGGAPVALSDYITWWNTLVPQARLLKPSASFGGPALATEFGMAPIPSDNFMQRWLDACAVSGVIPDFVTYHWYIGSTANATQYCAGHGGTVYTWLKTKFPTKNIPLGITEWNGDPGNPAWMYDDAQTAAFMTAALAGFEANPYLTFLTQYDLASYAGYGALDMLRASASAYTNTPTPMGSPRPMFTVLANEIARLRTKGCPPR